MKMSREETLGNQTPNYVFFLIDIGVLNAFNRLLIPYLNRHVAPLGQGARAIAIFLPTYSPLWG